MVALSSDVFAAARTHMVDSQLRPNKVTEQRLFDVFGSLPRESFFPAAQVSRAYADENVRVANGRAILAPMTIARIIQEARIEAGHKVLVVGAGNGYGAAAAAKLGAKVTALENDPALAQLARLGLAQHTPGVTLVTGPFAEGWAANAPYDAIIVEGAVDFVPEALVAQLAVNGRIVLIRHDKASVGAVAVGVHSGDSLSFVPKFDISAPVLPGLAREVAFVF